MLSVTIIGAGRVGGALAIALSNAGCMVDEVRYRGERFVPILQSRLPGKTRFIPHTEPFVSASDVLIIASGDPDIRSLADSLSLAEKLPTFAFHTSGSLSSAELASLADRGVLTASLHPLAALSEPVAGSERFRDAYFCIEGEPAAVATARAVAQDLGGIPFAVPTEAKSLYHASAVTAAGHVVALFATAVEMLARCGLSREEAANVLRPLTAGSIANLQDRAPVEALTGPLARGDATALDRHLSAFDTFGIDKSTRELYLRLALRSVEMKIAAGSPFEHLRDRILMAKPDGEC